MELTVELHIKEIRKERGMSLRQLEELSWVSKSHIADIENKLTVPTIYIVCCLAVALGVDLECLVSYKLK